MALRSKKPDLSSWKKTKLENHLPHVTGGVSWVAERGILKWFLYVYKTNTFHLFTTREARRKLEKKLRGKTKKTTDVARRGRFKNPLLHWVDFFVRK
jgi:hypothetical protein